MSEEMPKRNRADSQDGAPAHPADVVEVVDSTPTIEPRDVEEVGEATPPHADRDPLLEQQLNDLDIDEDFRESIRAMTPNTRHDVLNDIIRHQQNVSVEGGLPTFSMPMNAFGGLFFPFEVGSAGEMLDEHEDSHNDSEERDQVSSEERTEEGGEDDVLHLGDDRQSRSARPFNPGQANSMFGRQASDVETDGDGPHLHSIDEHGVPMGLIDLLQLVMQRAGGQPTVPPGMRGRATASQQQRAVLEGGMVNLQNFIGVLHQANMMQSMGLDRDIDDMSYEELLELEERIGNVSKGVPPAQLESCMTRMEPSAPDETCAVCQEELSVAASASADVAPVSANRISVRLLNCPHAFHKSCIKQWLRNNKTCPVCKQEVLPHV
ncbi:hypothetical protein ABL78_3793 [Leptomonas seymouri]|uniref:RING-type E3 ubiquitin transferase n=1 Tax=Leptomonas seymouri TaxID=5684 RepID=A0A0N1IKS7_LEPSE|nr:hypothetical protein ABL78_3793 [Leptomonas seymouri]|eukprot:KPI87140.1 hypothetical protein ABL78_3793 [Leptomonas seymouri]